MSDEKIVLEGFGDIEMDAIGEIMNITMGSADSSFQHAFREGMDYNP